MSEFSLLSAFLIGVAGSVHCVGMCGGIVGAFSFILPKEQSPVPYMLAYNFGRVLSYTIAGMITGTLGAIFSHQVSGGLRILNLLSAIFLLLLALYIGGWWKVLTKLEVLGSILWKRVSPLSKKLLPFQSPVQAIPYGIIWGWLPCGLVYSTLTWSLASGSALQGALVMLSFGIGTLPALLTLGATSNQLRPLLAKPQIRTIIATLLFIFAVLLIFRHSVNI